MKNKSLEPIFYALLISISIFIGYNLHPKKPDSKILDILKLIEENYVDTIDGNFEEKIISSAEKALNLDQINSIRPSQGSFFVGNGCQLVDEYLRKLDSKVYERYPNAEDLLREAEIRLRVGNTLDPKELAPVYLTGEEHWAKN